LSDSLSESETNNNTRESQAMRGRSKHITYRPAYHRTNDKLTTSVLVRKKAVVF